MQSDGFTMRAFYRTAFFATAVIVGSLLVGVCLAKMARADGYAGYKDERPTHPVFQHRNSSGELKRYLTPEEKRILKRIHRDASARMNGRTVARNRFSRTVTVFQEKPRSRYIEPIRYERDTRECKAPIDVTGHERLGRERAANSARNAWRTTTSDRHGYRFANLDLARNADLDCTKVRGNTFSVYVCALVARPCREF
jgi:hypothetical protein